MDPAAAADSSTATMTAAIGAHLLGDVELRDEVLGEVSSDELQTVARRLVVQLVGTLELLGRAFAEDPDEYVRAYLATLAAGQP
jgi:hypothetical protein